MKTSKSTNFYMNLFRSIFFGLFLLAGSNLLATPITNINELTPTTCTLSVACTLQFEAIGGTPGYTWTMYEDPDNIPLFPDFLSLDNSGVATQEVIVDETTATEGTYYFAIEVEDSEAFNRAEIVELNIVRANYSLMYVLDRSGSMASLASDDSKYSDSKWDLVTENVNTLNNTLNTYVIDGDQAGAVYFNNTTTDFSTGGLFNIDGGLVRDMYDDMKNTSPTSSTGLGQGILDAIGYFSDESQPRHLIIFSDGMQNVSPLVEYDPDVQINDKILSETGIKMHTIVVGHMSVAENLYQISDATGGEKAYTDNMESAPDLDLFFTQTFVDMLRSSSPQIVDYRYSEYPAENTQTFEIGKNADKVLLKLNWQLD